VTTVADSLAAGRIPGFSVVHDPEGARLVVGLRPSADDEQAERALLDLHRGLRLLAGDYGPRSVDLPGGPAVGAHRYAEAFGAKVRFGSGAALLRLPAGVLSQHVGVPVVRRSELAWRVRRELGDRLGGGSATLTDVARAVALHPRSLQRHLADEGLAFGEILDCVRREHARGYLLGTGLSLTRISARLGFAEPSVLSRSVRRWFGMSPTQLRG
jgi:AraC-like DNA-binding protein